VERTEYATVEHNRRIIADFSDGNILARRFIELEGSGG